ncbi:MAG: hypothetical protein WA738_04190 [Candidatus Angelobacter sp.]
MKTAKNACGFIGCALVLAVLLAGASPAADNANGMVAVVNPTNPINDLSVTDLRRILLGERRFWKGNVQVKLALPQAGSRERDKLIGSLLGISTAEFARHWRAKVFRGEAPDEPLSLPDSSMGQYVVETPGALALITRKNLPAGVKVLKIGGKGPGESSYVLQ